MLLYSATMDAFQTTRGPARWARTLATTTTTPATTLASPSVLQHLVCPISKLPLEHLEAQGILFCREIRVAYPIRGGIPILVPTEGRIVPEDEPLPSLA
ncbi:hypothetical protein SPRG_05496 [Saprolegnia parasitica CBS 223.65]|uniref:Protein preY, mitochondrial n=1 Tax=Saprolegnia parasitica (strain CBS 223.65) TaxID=695850 RepID=A0A067CK19_SAPPC|nr:hypothetical protein SPRG_05496 [Saprolegnia parasitica CBS 223.65]KDO29540.1 hypothetical protein SPRG_05496 [Saprolegnia parasitica CBS 223.65]|eukprot:XP_012199605.1 hypothetical protein SPRG_05496 [Saprolegnia parasitica CBS 223.65]